MDSEDDYPNPIRVTPGGGMAVRFAVPDFIVSRLGGNVQLTRRLESVSQMEGEKFAADTAGTAALSGIFDELFDQPIVFDYLHPTIVEGQGFVVAIPIPPDVVEHLGGSAHLSNRILGEARHQSSPDVAPHSIERTSELFDLLVTRLEADIGPGSNNPQRSP